MDYDNNDIQDHNNKLSGEESSKLSPVLHPYALPKFDFDDNLQGHLRFDTLVGNEGFLGISSQEDNQWIEDFSRGSSGIEFSSSATESCSISRRNNVWFEATSSESVEMLLKSVGQDEVILGEAIIQEADAGDELGRLTKKMEPSLKQDDEMGSSIAQPASPLDHVIDGQEDSTKVEHNNVVCTSEAKRDDPPDFVCSGEINSNIVVGVIVSEETADAEKKCDDGNRLEVENSVNKLPTHDMKEISSVSTVHIETLNVENVSSENVDALPKDNFKEIVEHNDQSKDSTVADRILSGTAVCTKEVEYPVCADTRVEPMIEQKVEIKVTTSEDPSRSPAKEDHHFHLLEESKNDMDSTEPSQHVEAVVCTADPGTCDQLEASLHEGSDVICQGDKSPKDKVVEVESAKAVTFACPEKEMDVVEEKKDMGRQVISLEGQNIEIINKEAEISSCPELEIVSVVKKDKLLESGSQVDTNVLAEGVVFVDHKAGKWGVGTARDVVGDVSSSTGACSSMKLLTEQPPNEDLIPNDYKLPLTCGESVQPEGNELFSEGGGVNNCDQVVALQGNCNEDSQTRSIEEECKVVGSLVSDVCGEENIMETHGSESSRVTKELESNTVEKNPNYSCNTLNGGTGLAADVEISQEQNTEVAIMSMEVDNKYAAGNVGHKDTVRLCLKDSLQVADDLEPAIGDEKDATNQCDQEVTGGFKECSTKLEVSSVLSNSRVENVCGTEASDSENHNTMLVERNAEVALVQAPESMVISMTERCSDQRQKNHESTLAPKTHTMQNDPSTKDDHQASVTTAHPSKYGSHSLNEGGGTVSPIEDREDRQLEIKETTTESVQPFKSIGADGTDNSVPLNSGNEATRGLDSFSFDVCPSSGPSDGKPSAGFQSMPNIQIEKVQMDIRKSPLTSSSTQIDRQMVPEVSHETPQPPVGGIAQVGVKGTPERKTRRVSGKTTVRSAKKRNNAKETTPVGQSVKGDTSLVFMHTPGKGQHVQFEELKRSGDVAVTRSGAKPPSFLPIPTSNLLDLNTSVPPAAVFQQPFTEFQQVQLRAQIIVYGSLIQDSAPDEACMISAFGPSEGSRNLWEPAWRACVERVQAPKSHASKLGTPIQSHSGSKAPVQPVKHSARQNKVTSSPAGRVSSKGMPSPAVTPIIPLSSPLWNVSTPSDGLHSSGLPRGGSADCHQPLSPIHPYQVPGITNVVGHGPSWISQSPFTSPWMTSPQTSAFDANSRSSVFPDTDPMKITPAKDSSVAGPSFPATKHASFPTVVHDNRGAAVSAGPSQPFVNKVAAIPKSADSKPRKRKKVPANEGLGQITFLAPNQGTSVSSPVVGSQLSSVTEIAGQNLLLAQGRSDSVPTANTLFSTSVTVTTPDFFTSASNSGKFPATMSPTLSRDQLNRVDHNVEKKSMVSEETSDAVQEARLHAETAASHAANAVIHYHDVWSQLARQKNSGLICDVDAKLASAAVAITAATSVAKAAAAAAKIASNVAVQAKLMADEVSSSSVNVDPTQSNSSSKATSSTVLNSGDGSAYPSSIIAVAREASKKRVEAASAASKHAENLEAIVKAAELAAEAVSQAGRILSIGDSMPLSKLEELGPVVTEKGTNKRIADGDQPKAFSIELYNFSAEELKGGSSGVEEAKKSSKLTSLEKVSFGAQRGHRASGLAEITGFVPEPEAGLRTVSVIADDACANAAGLSIETGMKEGCLVEVFKDGGSCKAAWYSANILSLKDGKAFVCYTDLQADDGTGLLKEWVPLQGDSISKPTIRIAHPLTRMQFDGTRRKRKAAVMDYSWSVGDRVDAWMQDCWREGVVKEKDKNDETAFTIHFPALSNTSVVRAWHLRPSLTWQDGKWTEWSSPRHHLPFQGDGPQEKRVRLDSPIEAKGKDKVVGGVDLIESRKHDESKLLPLAENELEFNTGKNTTHESKLESRRTMRTGLQKEGSRVVFGVPKPGKKRKFMDVSKHFDIAQGSKNIRTGDPFKFGKNVTPQVSGSHGWKTSTKIDFKEKHAAEDKPKVLRSGKPPGASSRALPRKDNISSSFKSTTRDATTIAADKMSEEAISSEENDMGQQNMMEFGSVSDSQDTSEGQTLACSLNPPKVARRKGFSSHVRPERLNKGKSVPSGGRMGKKVELQEKSVPEVAEPRRSNRRIQPTSRLLEGLQSSLSISKIPFSHDKTHRSQSRSKF